MKSSNIKETFYFIGVTGFGLLTSATLKGKSFKRLGSFAYVLAGIITLFSHKAVDISLELGGTIIKTTSLLLACSNTTYISNLMIAPKASYIDGLIDIVNIKNMSKFKLLRFIPSAYTGKHIKHEEVEYYKASKVRIISTPPLIPSPDGEFVDETPITIECLKQLLPVLV